MKNKIEHYIIYTKIQILMTYFLKKIEVNISFK